MQLHYKKKKAIEEFYKKRTLRYISRILLELMMTFAKLPLLLPVAIGLVAVAQGYTDFGNGNLYRLSALQDATLETSALTQWK